ncbi:MAG TPA: ElyC/SanA/YdcF family protein [Moheibacter sp.]|nr:ElyC/SanA/YdcF family protein [Moheibacter sp.]
MKTFFRRFFKLILSGIIFITFLLLFSNYWVNQQAEDYLYDQIEALPNNRSGLVLGTSKKVRGGAENLYFKYRIEAAAQLFQAGKVKFLIVSGDNSIQEYNETRDMKKALIQMGVPEESIIEDFAGFRTLDSVIRGKEVFGQDSVTIISQKFQNQRAIFIAKNHDIYALGFNAQDVPKQYGTLTNTREYFARVKALLDVYVLGQMPKFYKDKEVFPNEE